MMALFKPIQDGKQNNKKLFPCLVHNAVRLSSKAKDNGKKNEVMNRGIVSVANKTVFCPSTDLTTFESYDIDVFYDVGTPADRIFDESVKRLVERVPENENVLIVTCGSAENDALPRALMRHAVSQIFRSCNKVSICVSVLTIPSSGDKLQDSLSLVTKTEASPVLGNASRLEGNVALQIKSEKDFRTMFRTLKDREELKDKTRHVLISLRASGKNFSSYVRVLNLSQDLQEICSNKTSKIESIERLREDLELVKREDKSKTSHSVLSIILRDALNANTHCSIIANVSPRIENVSTSLAALRFSDRVRMLSKRASASSFSARKSVILADELSVKNIEKRKSLFEIETDVAAASSSEDSVVENEVRPMTPPPGAIRKEGMRWVATFQTPNREDHYVGTFASQTEALAAYYERASYYEKLRHVVTSSPSPKSGRSSSSSSTKMRKLRILLRRHAVSGGQLFNYMDSKRCGRITFEMFKHGLAMVGIHPSRNDAMKIFHEIDRDGDGIILWSDLVQMFTASPRKNNKTRLNSSPLSNYQKRVRASSPDLSREVEEEEEDEKKKQERYIRESHHRRSSADWLQSLRSPSSSPTSKSKKGDQTQPKSPLRTREKKNKKNEIFEDDVNIPKNAIRREGLYWIATYQTPDHEDHYVGTFRTYDLAVKRYLERASYYRKTSEEKEEPITRLEGDDEKQSDEKNLLSPSLPASHDDMNHREVEEKPTPYDQETKLFIRTADKFKEEEEEEDKEEKDKEEDILLENMTMSTITTTKQQRETISTTDELVEIVRYLRQRLRRADRDIKDYEVYRDVMETTLCNLQREMSILRKERDMLMKRNEKMRTVSKRKEVKVARLEKLVKDLKSKVSDLESSVTANKAALLFSEERCQDLTAEMNGIRGIHFDGDDE